MTAASRHPQSLRYLIDVGPAALAYFTSVLLSSYLCKSMEPGVWRVLVAGLPLPAIGWMAYAELARLRRRDELRQRVELESMTMAFGVSFALIAMLTFLDMNGAIDVPMPVAAILMAACWCGAQVWVRMRYRYWWRQPGPEEDA